MTPSEIYALAKKKGLAPLLDEFGEQWWREFQTGAARVWRPRRNGGYVAFEVSGEFATDHEALYAYALGHDWLQEEWEERLLSQRLLFAQQLVRVHERDHRSQVPNALRPFDFCCSRCCPPEGPWTIDNVKEGFVCAYHLAKEVVEGK